MNSDRPVDPLLAPILDDLRCSQCEYLLRGLPLEGDCPECGQPVERTLAAVADRMQRKIDRPKFWAGLWAITFGLYDAPPLFTESRRQRWGMVVATVCLLTMQVVLAEARSSDPTPGRFGWTNFPTRSAYVAAFIAAGLFWAAVLLLAMGPARAPFVKRYESAKLWLFRCCGVAPLWVVANAYAADFAVPWFEAPKFDRFAWWGSIAAHLATVLLFDRIAGLAARLPNVMLAVLSKLLAYGSIFPGAALVIFATPIREPLNILVFAVSPSLLIGFGVAVVLDLLSKGRPTTPSNGAAA